MNELLTMTVVGFALGCIYALTASGLVVTYTTSGIFNFAHGAIGMVLAFTYWELTVDRGLPQWLGLLLVLGVFAPLLGAAVERILMRGLHGTTTSTQLVVTLGLLLALLGLASLRWNPTEPRVLPEFFLGNSVRLASVNVSYHQLTMVTVTIAVAVFLRLFFYRSRIGIAMRAVVDDPELAALNGADPDRVSSASWALGAVLAGAAGILLAPLVSLDVILLTLLVVNGYAAAMVGRLKSLPLTFAGGIALGILESYAIGLDIVPTEWRSLLKPALPTIFLYVVLLALPQARLRAGRVVGTRRAPRVATLRQSIVGSVAFIAAACVAALVLQPRDLTTVAQGVVYALIMLSLVLLVGYAGQVSLCQMTFVGLGAFAMGSWFGGSSILGLLAAAVLSGVVGAIAALPALRLQGLYLALSTLAFAQGMSTMFFKSKWGFGYGGSLRVGRPELFGLSFRSDKAYFLLICVVFALSGIAVLALRRGRFGRRLVAMKDSPAACATLGLNLTFSKLAVFAISASMAGVAGVFHGGLRSQIGPNDVEMLNSLVLLLLVSVSGINTVSGALAGGLSFGLFPRIQAAVPALRNLTYIGAGLGALGIGRNPNGWTSQVTANLERLRPRRGDPPPPPPAPETVVAESPRHQQEEVKELAGASR